MISLRLRLLTAFGSILRLSCSKPPPVSAPPLIPQTTETDGRYVWDIEEGCWYIIVNAPDYATQVSPLFGVPPAVTDLDITLAKGRTYLPILLKQQ